MRIEIRGRRKRVWPEAADWIEDKCRLAFGRIVREVSSVRIVVTDQNGPRGGVDQKCSVAVTMNDGEQVRAEVEDAELFPAVEQAVAKAARSAHRLLSMRGEYERRSIRQSEV